MKRSKRYKEAAQMVTQEQYSIGEAIDILLKMPHAKFDETVEISCKLSADPKKSDQMIRGSVMFPHGTGKEVKVIVFCEPEKEEIAKSAGADYIGTQETVEKIVKEGWLEFDSCISTPSMMRVVSRLGKVLGPRGLMPSPKTGTVTDDLAAAVKDAKAGKVDFRMDKFACLAVGAGKVSFSNVQLVENIQAFIDTLNSVRPAAVKGDFIKSIYLSTSMSPALAIKN